MNGMTTTPRFPMAEHATAYRAAYNDRMSALYRLTKPKLRSIDRAHMAAQGVERIYGGPATREELIRAILDDEYPVSLLNESSHVIWHQPGESWSACRWCHPHDGGTCECELRDPDCDICQTTAGCRCNEGNR